jgi:hypothetical protein
MFKFNLFLHHSSMLPDWYYKNGNDKQSHTQEKNAPRYERNLLLHIAKGKKSSNNAEHEKYNRCTQHSWMDLVWYSIGKAYAKEFDN